MKATDPVEKESATLMRRIQQFVEQIEQHPNPQTRDSIQQCLEAVLEIYGSGLERIIRMTEGDEALRNRMADDSLVCGLLLIHGLHPVPLEARLRKALQEVRPYLESHGGNVELTHCEHGVARIRLEGHCRTCPSSSVTLELAIRQAIDEACPDLDRLEVEGVAQSGLPTFHLPASAPAWHVLGREDGLSTKELSAVEVEGQGVLICLAKGLRYAYRNRCPACGADLEEGSLDGEVLSCPCGQRFNVRKAGASLEKSKYHLDPLPLVTTDGMIKVAIQPIVTKEAA